MQSAPAELTSISGRGVFEPHSGELLDRVVVVRGDRILGLERTHPENARIVDVGDQVISPGLTDVHTHILLHGNKGAEEARYQLMEEYPAHRIAHAVQALRIALDHGFTTIRDLGSEGAGYADIALRDAVNEGIIDGPRMLAAGPALSSTGSYPVQHFRPDWAFPSGVQVVDGVDECRRGVREQISFGVDWIKVYANAGAGRQLTDDGYIDSAPNWTAAELTAIVDEAHLRGRRVAAHATSDTGVRMAVEAGADSIEHGYSIRPDVARLMVERGVFLCPTIIAADHVVEHRAQERGPIWSGVMEVQRKSIRNSLEAGVKIVFGTDVGGFPWTQHNQAEELGFLERAGVPRAEILRGATTLAAELLELQGEIGSLQPGCSADIIAVDGDPRSSLGAYEKVGFVMQRGRIVRAAVQGE
jgi:imidazolonepropionase-like amidohydrolase